MSESGLEPRVSIALATYNGARYIREQLDSLAAQTMLPAELVVTDDGSTDQTIQIIENFARSAPFPVRIFRNEPKLGFAENFLRAATLCTNDLIAFCDQDDVWMKEKLRKCAPYFADRDVLLVVHAGRLWYKGNELADKWPDIRQNFLIGKRQAYPLKSDTIYAGFAMVFRRSILGFVGNDVRPYNIFELGDRLSKLPHDGWVWFLCSSFGKVQTISDVLCWYRQHETNTIGGRRSRGLIGAVAMSIETKNYRRLSVLEESTAALCDQWAADRSFEYRDDAAYWASYYRWRSKLHLTRSAIYDPATSLYRRIRAVSEIAVSGGYMSSRPSPSFGKRAFLKDVLIGVFRIDHLMLATGLIRTKGT